MKRLKKKSGKDRNTSTATRKSGMSAYDESPGNKQARQQSQVLSRDAMEMVLSGRREISDNLKERMLDLLEVVARTSRTPNNIGKEFYDLWWLNGDIPYHVWDGIIGEVLGLPPGEAEALAVAYEDRCAREGEYTPRESIMTEQALPADDNGTPERNGLLAEEKEPVRPADAPPAASEHSQECAAETGQSGPVTQTGGTGCGNAVTCVSSDQSSGAEPGQPVQPSQQNYSPKELPVFSEVPVDSIAPVEVPITALEKKHAIQSREKLNEKQVKHYMERMFAKDKFPPVEAYRINGVLSLTDGFHRLKAAQQTGQQTIWCIIREGTRKDAIRAAIMANRDHGLPRTNADKRRGANLAVKTFPNYSNHQLAELCHVSHTFMAKIRKELATDSSCEPRLGRDGKRRKMPTTAGGKGEKTGQNAETPPETSTPDNDISPTSAEGDTAPHEQEQDEMAPEQDQPGDPYVSDVREDAVSGACDQIEAFVQEQIVGFSSTEKARVAEELRALADQISE